MALDFSSYLRLDIEVPVDGGLTNLVQNPDGELGSWFWVTPVTNTAVSTGSDADGPYLKFTTTAAQACHFTSEYIPATVGDYYQAQVNVVDVTTTTSAVRLRFEWYDSAKALLSSSAQTALTTTNGVLYTAEYVAPASTAYVKLRVDFYNSAGGNPSANDWFSFRNAMVTVSDTGTAATTRTNLVKNPSFETNTTHWSSVRSGQTLAQSSTYAKQGTYSLKVTEDTGGVTGNYLAVTTATGTSGMAVTGGLPYHAAATLYNASGAGRTGKVNIKWYTSTGALISYPYASESLAQGAWDRVQLTATAPSNAAYAAIEVTYSIGSGNIPNNESFYVDEVMFEQASAWIGYFDGSFTDTSEWTYDWSGTAHNSTSTRVSLGDAFDYYPPNDWRDVLGPAHEVRVERGALDVGTLSATIFDAELDPSTYSELRPGKKMRLRTSAGVNLFSGKIANATVNYLRDETRIELEAVDAAAALANQTATEGVEDIADLPYILEGRSVPFSVNGSGNQVTSATIVSENENASVLDQVAITRDTALGYAWVDGNGVLNVYDSAQMGNAVVATFKDALSGGELADPENYGSYYDIDVNFNTESCINDVTVTWLRYVSATGETTEITYGPYRDATSIATWGPHAANFTIHGATESSASISTYANAILTANATPEIRVNSIDVPVRTPEEITLISGIDLYSLVNVVYDTPTVDGDYRVTGISHQITPGEWTTHLSFEVDGMVATPTVAPSPDTGGTVTVNTMEALHLTRGTDATTSAGNAPALRIADLTGNHMRIDSNEIIAMSDDDTQSTLNLNPGGGNVIGNGMTVSAIAFGDDTVTTDASGIATITHGLGTTPTSVVITPRNNGTNHICTVTARGSTTFSFRVVNDAGATTASASRSFCWIAIA